MTLKMKMIGAVLASALLGGVGQAKADVVRVDARPGNPGFVQPAPGRDGWRQDRQDRQDRRDQHDRYTGFQRAADRGHGYAARGENPSQVAREIRAEADQAGRDLRFDVRRGTVEPRAIPALDAGRQQIERTLAAVSVKGFVTARDRADLERQVQQIRDLQTQFRCARPAPARYRR